MELCDLDKSVFYKVSIYLDIDDLKKLEKTNKKYQNQIRSNSQIENRILKYDYNIAKNQLRTFKKSPLLSCIDFLEEKKLENGKIVDRFEDKQKLYDYVKNKYYFQNYRFESLYDSQFRIFQNKLKKNKIKKPIVKEKPLLLFKQTNNEKEIIKKIDKNVDSYKIFEDFYENKEKNIILPFEKKLTEQDKKELYEIEVLLNMQKNIKNISKNLKKNGKKFCPYLRITNFFKKE